MAFFHSPVALVNRSSTNIPVYSKFVHSSVHTGSQTAGGEQIGQIYPNEFYTLVPSSVSPQPRLKRLMAKPTISLQCTTQLVRIWTLTASLKVRCLLEHNWRH